MATMTAAQQRDCWADAMERWSADRKSIPATKGVFLNGIEAIDQWISDNAASFNAALPAVLRNNLTTPQKVELFVFVLRSRFLNGT